MSEPDLSGLSALTSAAEARRRARKRLRTTMTALAKTMLDDLRAGDSVTIQRSGIRARYGVENVTWRIWAPGHEGDTIRTEWVDFDRPTLTRIPEDGRACALYDCRTTLHDEEGVPWRAVGRDVYLPQARVMNSSSWDPYTRRVGGDDDLRTFATEAPLVIAAFAAALAAEADGFERDVETLLRGGAG